MFHHLNIVPGLLAAALLLSAPVQAALPAYSAVKDEAKTVNKYMIVVWAGTDWRSHPRRGAPGQGLPGTRPLVHPGRTGGNDGRGKEAAQASR